MDVVVGVAARDGEWWLEGLDGTMRTGRSPRNDVELWIRSEIVDTEAALLGHVTSSVAALAVQFLAGDGKWVLFPPFDVGAQSPLEEPIRNATCVVQRRLTATPVGDVDYCDVFTDGRLVERRGGVDHDAVVTVARAFADLVTEMLGGERAAFTVAARNVTDVMLVAGLYDAPELRAHLGQHARELEVLVRLATHTQSQAWIKRAVDVGG